MKKALSFAGLLILAASCIQTIGDSPVPSAGSVDAADFGFQTAQRFSLSIATLDNHSKPLSNVPLEVGFMNDDQFVQIATLVTNKYGNASFQNALPSYLEELVIKTDYLGLPNESHLPVKAGANSLTLGGTSTSSGRISSGSISSSSRTSGALSYLSTYDANGVPNNLEPVSDYISQDLLDLVNTSLPEGKPVPTANPQYLSNSTDTDTRLSSEADVWVTFVGEGAGYRNALGYYTYDLNNPPTTASAIQDFKIIFPNVSLPGSGGNLATGSKVSLGRFPANTGIGWFLVPNGWNGSSVAMKSDTKYSTKVLNTFTTETYRQHTVLLNDPNRELLLLGMEDISRPGGDNDFNDAVFYVTANPYKAIVTDNLIATKQPTGTDTDTDGVLDKNDKYPTDSQRAFDIYTPGNGVYGSLAFEDQWPSKGDYDMNDLVVDYNFQMVANTANAVVEIRANFLVKAVGAAYKNGFGIELPVSPDKVQSVTGTLDGTLVKKSVNGTEANQSKAVIVVFENALSLFNTSGFINTKSSEPYLQPVAFNVVIKLNEPVKMTDLGYAPFNAFIFANGYRNREVHLADFTPTDLADKSLFGTSADNSRPVDGRYYKAANNLPWAINIALPFDYPQESRPVSDSYSKFAPWSQSAGSSYKDWYKDLSGYREATLIYKKK